MKLGILFFVLTAIIYGCQCAASPDWVRDVHRDIDDLHDQLYEQSGTERLQVHNGITVHSHHGRSRSGYTYTSTQTTKTEIIEEEIINNVIYRTKKTYNWETNKTIIYKYECIPPSSPCILKTTEIKDGPPENLNENL